MYYAHKKSLISVNVTEKDGVLITQSGDIPVKEGSVIAHNELGNPFLLNEEDFHINYVPVEKVKHTTEKKFNIDDIANGYIQMGYLVEESNINDENYIFEVKNN